MVSFPRCGRTSRALCKARAGPILHWGAKAAPVGLDPAQRVRLAFEELGPACI